MPELLAIGGFTARSTALGDAAIGQIQARTTPAYNPLTTLASLHGKVVGIANRGPGLPVGGTNADVWEVQNDEASGDQWTPGQALQGQRL